MTAAVSGVTRLRVPKMGLAFDARGAMGTITHYDRDDEYGLDALRVGTLSALRVEYK